MTRRIVILTIALAAATGVWHAATETPTEQAAVHVASVYNGTPLALGLCVGL